MSSISVIIISRPERWRKPRERLSYGMQTRVDSSAWYSRYGFMNFQFFFVFNTRSPRRNRRRVRERPSDTMTQPSGERCIREECLSWLRSRTVPRTSCCTLGGSLEKRHERRGRRKPESEGRPEEEKTKKKKTGTAGVSE